MQIDILSLMTDNNDNNTPIDSTPPTTPPVDNTPVSSPSIPDRPPIIWDDVWHARNQAPNIGDLQQKSTE